MTAKEFVDLETRCDVARAKYTPHNKPKVLVDALLLHELLQTYDQVKAPLDRLRQASAE